MLAGRGRTITHIFPAANALASATAYEIAPKELFRVMKEIRAANLQMLGIYHSHPHGEIVRREATSSARSIQRRPTLFFRRCPMRRSRCAPSRFAKAKLPNWKSRSHPSRESPDSLLRSE